MKTEATEVFATMKNRFWATAIFAKGKRLNAVDPNIAVDTIAVDDHNPVKAVVSGYSCFICHGAEQGLNSFKDSQFDLLHPRKGSVYLGSNDPSLVRGIVEFYDEPELQRQMRFDREGHDAAVQSACGVDSSEATASLRAVLRQYNAPVSLATVESESGLNEAELRAAVPTTHDQILGLLFDGHSVARGSYESSLAELYAKIYSYRASRN